jgi:glucose-fructose oxidoreductase
MRATLAGASSNLQMPAPLRFAVVGLGDIAQRAVLPAFAHARAHASLTALVSGEAGKRRRLLRRFRADVECGYGEYDALLSSGAVDAVYIALPNHLHREFAQRALEAGVHVLCEKPMATTVEDARAMRRAARRGRAQLMVAYRLHFDPATLTAISAARHARAGEVRIFASVFSSPVERGDIRLERAGRGGLFDLGIYCVQAARMVFASEPIEVVAMHAGAGRSRFAEVPEMTAALLRYPGDRVAMILCSLHAERANWWSALSSRRVVRVEPAYHYAEPLAITVRTNGRARRHRYGVHDQFAAEVKYFVECVRRGRTPEPSAAEGEADVRILDAIDRSARTRRPVRVGKVPRDRAPASHQARAIPAPSVPRRVL